MRIASIDTATFGRADTTSQSHFFFPADGAVGLDAIAAGEQLHTCGINEIVLPEPLVSPATKANVEGLLGCRCALGYHLNGHQPSRPANWRLPTYWIQWRQRLDPPPRCRQAVNDV